MKNININIDDLVLKIISEVSKIDEIQTNDINKNTDAEYTDREIKIIYSETF